MKHLVFVYGTLKRGYHAYEYYLMRQNFIGQATSVRPFVMFDTGGFPVVLQSEDALQAQLRGEIYEVDDETVDRLDSYEGEGHMFKRQYQEFQVDNGDRVSAQVYFGVPQFWSDRKLRTAPRNCNGQFQWGCDAEATA